MAIRRSGRSADGQPTSPCPTARLCGTAVTVLLRPDDNWMLHLATRQLKPGDVVVAAWSTECEDGFFGELLATSMRARGGIGLVLDRCRYGAAPKPMKFRVLAGRSTPRARSRSSWAGSARPPSAPMRSSTPATWSLGRHWTADIDGWSSSPPHALAMSPKRPAVSSMRRRLRPPV
jgi:hypothetical protein